MTVLSAGSPAIWCRGLEKHFPGVAAVDGLDLEVVEGECFGLLGPNGAGKTTTVEILEGLQRPTRGSVELFGRRWGEGRDRELRERLGVQLQESHLPDKLTVAEVVRLFASFYRESRSVDEAIAIVHLEEKRDARVEKLSGGQKQRLSLACSLVGRPDLLFLDEPTTGLDPQARLRIWEVVRAFQARGRTVLLTTHYMEEASRLCDRVAILDRGRVIAEGSPTELVASLGADQIIEVTFDGTSGLDDEVLAQLPAVRGVSHRNRTAVLNVAEVAETLPALCVEAERRRVVLASLTTHHATLEDVFVSLTGRALRDD